MTRYAAALSPEYLLDVPRGWEVHRAKHLFRKLERPVRLDDEIVTAFRDGRVTLRRNRRESGFTNALEEVGYQGVRKGDLVIHGMDAFAGTVGVSDSDGKVSPVYSICAPRVEADVDYFAYLLKHMARAGYITSRAKGIRERSTEFRFKEFGQCALVVPPLEEQRAIVRFLDKETARIDLLLERKRELVAALSDRYETAIELAYIDDARHRRLKDVCQLIQCGPFGSQLGFDDYILGGIPVINPQDLAAEGIRGNPGTTIDEATFQRLRRHAVRDGDLVLARRGQMGNAGLVGNEHKGWLCGTGSMLIRGRMSVVRPEFLHMVITSPFSRCWLEANSVGTTMSNLNAGIVGRLPVPVPPLDEQDGMIGLVTEVRAESAALLDSVGSSIDRLREYRSALIAAVVTGQADVGSAA